MSELDHVHNELERVIKGTLEINPGLESILRIKEVKKAEKQLYGAFEMQMDKLLKSNLFENIDRRIGAPSGHVTKAESERIVTEDDDDEVYDACDEELQPIEEDSDTRKMLIALLLLVFKLGGQDFLNKHNIPATFELTNKRIIQNIERETVRTLKGIDQTTTKWVADQIITGREKGLSNAEIADTIRDVIPQTFKNRAETIIRTETSYMVGESENITAVNNGASQKSWVTVSNACPICLDNEAVGTIGVGELFPSGDEYEPAHPNCRCLVEYEFTPFMGFVWAGQ